MTYYERVSGFILGMKRVDWISQLREAGLITRNNVLFFRASELPSLLGYSAYKSPQELIKQRIAQEQVPTTEYMRAGIEHEPYIITKVAEKTGITLVTLADKFAKFKAGHVMGYDIEVGGAIDAMGHRRRILEDGSVLENKFIIEVKYMPNFTKEDIKDVPSWYKPQVFTYMIAHRANGIFGAMLADGWFIKELHYDDYVNEMNKMIEEILMVAEKVITGDILNEPDGVRQDAKKKVFSFKKSEENPIYKMLNDYVSFLKENRYIVDLYKDYEKKNEEYKRRIKNMLLEDGEYEIDSEELRISISTQYREYLEDKKLIEEHPELAELLNQYRTVRSFRVINLK